MAAERKLERMSRGTLLGLVVLAVAACGSDGGDDLPEIILHGDDNYYRPGQDYDRAEPETGGAIPAPVEMGGGDYDSPDFWDNLDQDLNAGDQPGGGRGPSYLPGAGAQAQTYEDFQREQELAMADPQQQSPRYGQQPAQQLPAQQPMYNYPPIIGSGDNAGGTAQLDGKTRIAILVPLSGPHARIGQSLFQAAEMALFANGVDDVVLMPRDTKGRPDVAAEQARDVLANGADLILGPLFAEAVSAVTPQAQRYGVSVVAFSNDRNVAQPGIFLMGFLPEQQVTRIIRFASDNGLQRFAALFPNNDYGRRVSNAFYDSVLQTGNLVAGTEVYFSDPQSMFDPVRRLTRYDERVEAYKEQVAELEEQDTPFARAALERLKDREAVGDVGFEAVLLPAGGTDLKSLAPLLPYYEVDPKDVKFLGTGLWGETGVGLEPSLVGGWYAGPPPGQEEKFLSQFETVFSSRPPRLASLGFDAMSLAIALHITGNGAKDSFSPRSITRPQGFAGMDGIFRFHNNGLNERGLAIVEVRRNGTRVIDPAPDRFNIYDAEWQQDTPDARARRRFNAPDEPWQRPANSNSSFDQFIGGQ